VCGKQAATFLCTAAAEGDYSLLRMLDEYVRSTHAEIRAQQMQSFGRNTSDLRYVCVPPPAGAA
jgi:hypothetical protein